MQSKTVEKTSVYSTILMQCPFLKTKQKCNRKININAFIKVKPKRNIFNLS